MNQLPPARSPPARHLRRIALADRDEVSAERTSSTLRSMGFAVRTVASGEALLALMEDGWPDLVVLDVVLPDVSGLVVCGQIRAQHDLPVVFYSASRRREDPILGRMLGADEFIAKSDRKSV